MLDPSQRSAKVLIPALQQLLAASKIKASEIGTVAVAVGPGSFTGLRIGITAAKTIAYATGAKLVATSTLDVLALQTEGGAGSRVWAALDAQRGDLFVACYAANDWKALGESDLTQLLAGDTWLAKLETGDTVIGPIVDRFADRLPPGIAMAKATQCQPQARTVAKLGLELAERGQLSDPFQLVPRYHRLSAAEEKARAKQR